MLEGRTAEEKEDSRERDRRRRRGGDEIVERRCGFTVRVAHRGGRVHECEDTRYVFNWLKFSIEAEKRKRDDPLLRVCVSSSVVFLSLSLCV